MSQGLLLPADTFHFFVMMWEIISLSKNWEVYDFLIFCNGFLPLFTSMLSIMLLLLYRLLEKTLISYKSI